MSADRPAADDGIADDLRRAAAEIRTQEAERSAVIDAAERAADCVIADDEA